MKTEYFSKLQGVAMKASAAGSMFMTMIMAAAPVFADSFKSFNSGQDVSGDTMVGTLADYVGTAFTYFGAIMIIPTVILFVLALRSENPDSWVHVGQIALVAVVSFFVGVLIRAILGLNSSGSSSSSSSSTTGSIINTVSQFMI